MSDVVSVVSGATVLFCIRVVDVGAVIARFMTLVCSSNDCMRYAKMRPTTMAPVRIPSQKRMKGFNLENFVASIEDLG